MKKVTVWILLILISFSVSGCSLFNSNETAEPLKFSDDVQKICIYDTETNQTLITGEKVSEVLSVLLSAEPTKKQSNNDSPSAKEYYEIVIVYKETSETLYMYEQKYLFGLISTWYIELPYCAVYKISDSSANFLLNVI